MILFSILFCLHLKSPSEYEKDLEEVIKDETSGDFTKALLAMLSAKKDESAEVDTELARKDAEVKSGFYLLFILLSTNPKNCTMQSTF